MLLTPGHEPRAHPRVPRRAGPERADEVVHAAVLLPRDDEAVGVLRRVAARGPARARASTCSSTRSSRRASGTRCRPTSAGGSCRSTSRSAASTPTSTSTRSYSFGLDDQEFVVAFEADDPARFLDLVQRLRTTEASALHQARHADVHVRRRPRWSGRSARSTATPLAETVRRLGCPPCCAPRRGSCALALALGRLRRRRRRRRAPAEDPVAQVPSGLQEQVRAAQDPQASDFPATDGKTLQELADSIGGGPEMGLAGSVYRAGRGEPRRVRRDRRQRRLRLRQDRALLSPRRRTSPAKGPFPAPADVLVTDAAVPLASRRRRRPTRSPRSTPTQVDARQARRPTR